MTGLIILASIIGLSALGSSIYLLAVSYNHLIKTRVKVDQNFANIDILLKQRADEIPELVKILKANMNYEHQQSDDLLRIYNSYQNSQDMDEKLQVAQAVNQALIECLAKNQTADFQCLKMRLSEIETQLAQKRESFNDSVTTFNALLLRIPYILIAAMLNIKSCRYLEISNAEKSYHGIEF